MQQMPSVSQDKFEIHLEEMILKLQTCQKEKNMKSCSECQHYLNCNLRDDYTSSVYNSMSKGETGGFEF